MTPDPSAPPPQAVTARRATAHPDAVRLAAVLWDMDGTLVDTEPYWIQAEKDLAARYNALWTDTDVLSVVGAGLWTTAAALQGRGVDLHADEIVATLTSAVMQRLAENGAPWRPGAVALLRELRDAGIPTALVTMSITRMAELVVSQLPFDGFDVLITGDVVSRPKPDPEPYLTALSRLGVDAAQTIAIEDSIPGVAAAVAAGAVTIAVPHVMQVPESADHTTWRTLQDHGLADLARVLGERSPL